MPSRTIINSRLRSQLIQAIGSSASLTFDEPMSRHTTFRIGGSADAFFEPENESEIIRALQYCAGQEIPVTLIGNGSNLLVSDHGIRGLVLSVGQPFSGLSIQGCCIEAKAGTRLSVLAGAAAKAQLTGLEFASGIPGTLGGAIQMNAGAYNACMQDVIVETDILDEQLNPVTITGQEHQFAYRHSLFSDRSVIIIKARMSLKNGDIKQIFDCMTDLANRRRCSQPLELPSAGSVFKRPAGYYAGKLISDCQLKGFAIGDAQVSEKHAGFIVNRGQATAHDVRKLIEHIRRTVLDQQGVRLETEIKVIGDWST